MKRSIVRFGLAIVIASLVAGVVAARQANVPLSVVFADFVGQVSCGWCGDGAAYTTAGTRVIAEIRYQEPVGAFNFYVASTSGRSIGFDFSRRVTAGAAWCPEVCPDQPAGSFAGFEADPIKTVALNDMAQWSPPNYDFLQPTICESGWTDDGLCANDFTLVLKTAKKEYKLRFSPNLWRGLALANTTPHGAMGVAYDQDNETWTLSPLLSHVIDGELRQEPCPVSLERKDQNKGLVKWTFLGCYDMPYQLTLTKR